MPALFGLDHKQLAIGLLGVTSGVAIYSTLKLLSERRKHQQQNVYESQKLLNEYLVFHYGSPREVLRYDFGPTDSVDFPKRCAELCWKHCKGKASSSVSSSSPVKCRTLSGFKFRVPAFEHHKIWCLQA